MERNPPRKPFRFRNHAYEKMETRELERWEIEEALEHPDHILPGRWPRTVFQKRHWDRILNREMLLRIVVEETDSYLDIVTVYKTSRFNKYER